MTDTKEHKKTRHAKPRRWRRRIVLTLLGGVVLYTLFGFFGVPLLIAKVGLPKLNERLAGTASLTKATFNPYTFALSLEGMEVVDDGGQRVFAFDRFDGNFQPGKSIIQSGRHFSQAVLTRPFVHGEILADGQINLVRLLEPAVPPPAPGETAEPLETIPRIVVETLSIADGEVSFRDQTRAEPFEATVGGLNFSIDRVDTREDHENVHHFSAATGRGGQLSWEGSFYVDPLSSKGTLSLKDIDLPQLLPYTLDYTKAKIVDGRLSIDLTYDFAPTKQPRLAQVDCSTLTIDDLELTRDEQPLLLVPQLQLTDVTIDGDTQHLNAALVRSSGGTVFIDRDESGRLAAQDLLTDRAETQAGDAGAVSQAATTDGQASAPAPAPGTQYPIVMLLQSIQGLLADVRSGWQLTVQRVELDQWGAEFSDQSPSRPVDIKVSGVQLAAGPIESEQGYRVPFELAATVNEGGTIDVRGEAAGIDGTFEAEIKTDALALSAIAPYLPAELADPIPPATLTSANLFLDGRATAAMSDSGLQGTWTGTTRIDGLAVDNAQTSASILAAERIEMSGDASVNLPKGGAFDASFQGDLEIATLAADLPEVQRSRLSLQTAAARGIAFSESGKTIAVNELTIDSPQLLAEFALLPAEAAAGDAPPAEAAPEPSREAAAPAGGALPYLITLQTLRINGSTIELTDPTAAPPLALRVDDLDVEVTNLSTAGESVADLSVSSRLQNSGQMKLNGQINPFASSIYTDVTLELSAVPLKPYDPFAGRYVGHLIDSGRLSATIPVKMESGQLDGAIEFDFDALHLGQSVDSPDAPNVPIGLGLDLLRDGNDHIASQLTFSGSLDDPSFSVGGIIWQAFINLLVKAATSPFDLLASAFASGEDVDLSQIVFDAGAAEWSPGALSAMDVLARALNERPELSLQVIGHYNRAIDERALQAEALTAELGGRSPYEAEVQRRYQEQAGDASNVPFEQMEAAVLSAYEIPQSTLVDLARQRAERTAAIFIQDGGLPAERVTVVEAAPDALEADEPKVEFQLN